LRKKGGRVSRKPLFSLLLRIPGPRSLLFTEGGMGKGGGLLPSLVVGKMSIDGFTGGYGGETIALISRGRIGGPPRLASQRQGSQK